MLITQSLKIDLMKKVVLPPVHAVQCDANTRAVAVTLTAAGMPWKPPAGVSASVAFKKPDGKKGWYDKLPDGSSACSVSGNVVTAVFAPEVLTAAGKVDAVIVFQSGNLNQLTTFSFVIDVERNPAAGSVISNDYYDLSDVGVGRSTRDGGEIFNDYEANQALSPYTKADGTGSRAGSYGYHTLSTTADGTITVSDASLTGNKAIDNYAVGDLICFDGQFHWYHELKISALSTNSAGNTVITVVTVDGRDMVDLTRDGSGDEFEDWVYVPGKPTAGIAGLFSYAAYAGGEGAVAVGRGARATGRNSQAIGNYATAIGRDSVAGYSAFAEGRATKATGLHSHAEGRGSKAIGANSHAEGYSTNANGNYAHSEGQGTKASGESAHAEGDHAEAKGVASHAEGYDTEANGDYSHAEGYYTVADGDRSHAEGYHTRTNGAYSHAEGSATLADGDCSHAEGYRAKSSGAISHAEGSETEASGKVSHAEGSGTVASGENSHAEGCETNASGSHSHAEGRGTAALGGYSHAEGYSNTASGPSAHAEGAGTVASGGRSHAEGNATIAASNNQHVQGKYNVEDADGKYAHIVGGGTSGDNRKNIHTVDWKGNAFFSGSIEATAVILQSATAGSSKKFRLTVDDNGTLKVTEV